MPPRSPRFRALGLLVGSLAGPPGLHALPQESTNARPATPQGDANQVATAFFDALEDDRWEDAARLVDPEVVAKFHRHQLDALTRPPVQPLTEGQLVEQMLRHDPEMPREAAAYQARRMTELRGENDTWLAQQFAGVTSAAEALALSPMELMARYLEANDPRYQFARSLEQAKRMAPEGWKLEDLEQHHPTVHRTVIGSVSEGDSLVHVVYSARESENMRPTVHVITLRGTGAGWRVMNPPLDGFGGASVVTFLKETPADSLPPHRKRGH